MHKEDTLEMHSYGGHEAITKLLRRLVHVERGKQVTCELNRCVNHT